MENVMLINQVKVKTRELAKLFSLLPTRDPCFTVIELTLRQFVLLKRKTKEKNTGKIS